MEEENHQNENVSIKEREHFISELHRFLVWVGEQLPNEVEINGESIKLHEMVWFCIHNIISEQEKEKLAEIVQILEIKERHDEETLQRANLTHEEAKKLYHDSAALIRGIMDLKECKSGKVKIKESGEDIIKKIEDSKRWMKFLKDVGKIEN